MSPRFQLIKFSLLLLLKLKTKEIIRGTPMLLWHRNDYDNYDIDALRKVSTNNRGEKGQKLGAPLDEKLMTKRHG